MTEFWIQPICGDAADKAFLCDQLVLKSKKDKQWSGTATIRSHILPSKPKGKEPNT